MSALSSGKVRLSSSYPPLDEFEGDVGSERDDEVKKG
jgi:hypothetical protein